MSPTNLEARLAALEARAPGRADPPDLPTGRRHRRLTAPIAIAPVLILAIAATAAAGGVAGGVVVANLVSGYPGVQNPGQPLEGANLECMTPREAATYLADHRFTDVVWQVETGTVGEKGGGSGQQATPPEHGYVVPGAILGDGQLVMIVDQRAGTVGGGACPNLPMP